MRLNLDLSILGSVKVKVSWFAAAEGGLRRPRVAESRDSYKRSNDVFFSVVCLLIINRVFMNNYRNSFLALYMHFLTVI